MRKSTHPPKSMAKRDKTTWLKVLVRREESQVGLHDKLINWTVVGNLGNRVRHEEPREWKELSFTKAEDKCQADWNFLGLPLVLISEVQQNQIITFLECCQQRKSITLRSQTSGFQDVCPGCMRGRMSIVLSHQACSGLLWQLCD